MSGLRPDNNNNNNNNNDDIARLFFNIHPTLKKKIIVVRLPDQCETHPARRELSQALTMRICIIAQHQDCSTLHCQPRNQAEYDATSQRQREPEAPIDPRHSDS